MSLGPLLGNERITRAFLRRDRLPNAILIAGADGNKVGESDPSFWGGTDHCGTGFDPDGFND